MEDLKSQFKDFVIPTAPSLLYEYQNSPQIKKKSSSSKLTILPINITAFIERAKSTSRITPISTVRRR
jgi:hypothetical protein